MRSAVHTWCLLMGLLAPLALAGDKWALVIGVDKCKALGELKVCAADARAVKELLEKAGYNVNLLADDTDDFANWPTIGSIRRGIGGLAEVAGHGDTILVFFSGHGVTRDGEGYLVPTDGDRDQSVALSWVKAKLNASPAEAKVLILDACHAGAAKGVNGIAPSHTARNKIAMLLSCKGGQVSWPDGKSGHSVFTRYVLEGLGGAAAGADGKVTQKELFEYVSKSVRSWAWAQKKPIQTPVMVGGVPEGLILASIPEGGLRVAIAPGARTGHGYANAQHKTSAPPRYVARGIVKHLGLVLRAPGTVRLHSGDKTIFFLKSSTTNLKQYCGKMVGVMGEVIDTAPKYDVDVINVTRVDVLDQDD